MRRAAILLALLPAWACNEAVPPAQALPPITRVYTRPNWLPRYGPEQEALLGVTPNVTVDELATPVYPDLERFAYGAPRPFSRDRALAQAARLQQQLAASPLLYSLRPTDPRLANPVAQYGPPPPSEPDPWVRTVRAGERYELVWARPSPPARHHVEAGNRALAAGDPLTAAQRLRAAAETDPDVPELWVALGRVHASSGDDAAAEAAFLEALGVDARCFAAHLELARLYERRGATDDVRSAIAHALAIHPPSPAARDVAARLGPRQPGPPLPATFIEVGSSGAIVVGTTGGAGARAFANCHAVLRHEPALRAELLGLPPDRPYHLSVAEEQLCVEVLLVSIDPEDPTEAALGEHLTRLAEPGFLTPFTLFEVLGPHRPEWLRLAPDELFDPIVDYVLGRVLPTP